MRDVTFTTHCHFLDLQNYPLNDEHFIFHSNWIKNNLSPLTTIPVFVFLFSKIREMWNWRDFASIQFHGRLYSLSFKGASANVFSLHIHTQELHYKHLKMQYHTQLSCPHTSTDTWLFWYGSQGALRLHNSSHVCGNTYRLTT